MYRLDCLGDICHLPLMKLMQFNEQLSRGESVTVITDHSCTCESLLSYCQKQHIGAKVNEPIPGVWEITISHDFDANKSS